MVRFLRRFSLVALMLLAIAPAAAARAKLGVMDQAYAHSEPERFWPDVLALNTKIVRFNIEWRLIAPTRPVAARDPADPAYAWAALDDLVKGAAANGIPVILTLVDPPAWSRQYPEVDLPSSAPLPTDVADFLYAAAIRYSGSYQPATETAPLPYVGKWEPWNEANITYFLEPQFHVGAYIGDQLYVGIANAAYDAIHQAAAERAIPTQVSLGSIQSTGGNIRQNRPFNWLRRVARLGPRFDAISIHPYTRSPRLGVHDNAEPPLLTLATLAKFVKLVDRQFPGRRPRFWITEYGFQSRPDPFGVKQKLQAQFLDEAVVILRRRFRRVDYVVNFLIVDEPEYPERGLNRWSGWQSGLRTADGRRKASYRAWRLLGERP